MKTTGLYCRLGWVAVLGIGLLLGSCARAGAGLDSPPGGDSNPAATLAPTSSPTAAASPLSALSPEVASSLTATPQPLPSPTAAPSPTPDAYSPPALAGNLENQVAGLEEHIPRAGSERFVVPSDEEKTAFSEITAALEAGDLAQAAALAAQFNYEIFRYTDHGDEDAESWLLRESKPIQRGWGLYVFRVSAPNDIIVEAPHPLYDEGTPSVALDVYRALNARALLIAGAHRDANRNGSADAAHTTQTVFQAIHEALTWQGSPLVLQIHGFADNKHLGYPQVIFGSDQPNASELLTRLAEALEAQGVRADVCDGLAWRDLCGETNAQSSTLQKGIFIHIELDKSLRANDDFLLGALAQAIGQ